MSKETNKRSDLEYLDQAVKRQNLITTVLIGLFLLQSVGFLWMTAQRFAGLGDEEYLVQMAEEKIQENYPEMRAALKKQLIQEAPVVAEKVSQRLRATVPEARKEVEGFLNHYMDKSLEEAEEFSKERFREFVRANKDMIRARYKDVKELPEESAEFVIQLEKGIDDQLGLDVRKGAGRVLGVQTALNDKMERLLQAPDLEPVELLERRILRLLRTIQLRDVGKIKLAADVSLKP